MKSEPSGDGSGGLTVRIDGRSRRIGFIIVATNIVVWIDELSLGVFIGFLKWLY